MEDSNRVFIMPDNLNSDESSLKVLKLKHPRTSTPMCCLLGPGGRLLEVVKFTEKYSSWLFGDMVIEDGSLHLVTPVDPLFFVLPYLDAEERFCPIQDVLVDESFPDAKYLQECCSREDLETITKCKDVMNMTVYSYDEKKTLKWLKKKVEHVTEALEQKEINIGDGSTAENYNPSSVGNSECDKQCTACCLICEYLPDELAGKVCSLFGFSALSEDTEKEESELQHGQKKSRTGEEMPLEDYSNCVSPLQQDKKIKLTSSQKLLQKTDKTGMKVISSFFQKK